MSLLKQTSPRRSCRKGQYFTFHYVSIKTIFRCKYILQFATLHSTMSLLKHGNAVDVTVARITFTFHYVSIKTTSRESTVMVSITLHSTMSLLKLRRREVICVRQSSLHSTMSLLKLILI